MQKAPELLPTTIEEGLAPGIRYRIDGEIVPVLHTWLDGRARRPTRAARSCRASV